MTQFLKEDGSGLSQGQRQLISIARAAVSNPPVMILDEATSSIDTRTEALVQSGMDKLMEGRTVFVIAHRLSTVKNADVIMVLDHGRIIERGNHAKLIAIARAAVADPPVMILDEATSSIDTRTEAIVQRGMDQLMEGRTVFVIAHRLSTVKNSDVIMVLDHGRIIERGSHEKLIAERGTYYQLYTGAFELE